MKYPLKPNEIFVNVHGHQFIRNKAANLDELKREMKNPRDSDYEIVYQCEGEYRKLSKTVPTCAEQNCADPPIYNPGSYQSRSRKGDSLSVTCNPGFYIPSVGSNFTSVTCKNGEWSGPIECVKIECGLLCIFKSAVIHYVAILNSVVNCMLP